MEKEAEKRVVATTALQFCSLLLGFPNSPLGSCLPKSSHESSTASVVDEESGLGLSKQEIEKLGRVRPECFNSRWSEVGFVVSICMSQLLTEYFFSGFNVLVPSVIEALEIPESSTTWPASVFSLVVSCFLLPFGRLSDMYGGKIMFILGVGWLVVWSVVAGLSQSELMLDFARALAGLGPAAFLPSSIKLLGSVYRPGPRKNLVFSMYGACAPLGFFLGIFFAGIAAQYNAWRWYFFAGASFAAISFVLAWLSVPSDRDEHETCGVRMDWPGAILIVSGLILVVFSVTSFAGAKHGWKTPYVPVTFVLGLTFLGVAVWVEGWIAEQPLVPGEIWRVPMFSPVIAAMFMQYGGLGIFLLYSTFYMERVMHATPLLIVAWFTPLFLGGMIIAAVGAFIFHVVPGTVFMFVAGVAWVLAPLLFAIMPSGVTYWTFVFPAMILATIGIDISFNLSNIFISTGLTKKQQGLAGAIINSNMHLSIAFFLGFADIISWGTKHRGDPLIPRLRYSYKCVFWFEVALALVALAIILVFVRVDRAKSDLTADEKALGREREKERVRSRLETP